MAFSDQRTEMPVIHGPRRMKIVDLGPDFLSKTRSQPWPTSPEGLAPGAAVAQRAPRALPVHPTTPGADIAMTDSAPSPPRPHAPRGTGRFSRSGTASRPHPLFPRLLRSCRRQWSFRRLPRLVDGQFLVSMN
jgi:hypothetical protein